MSSIVRHRPGVKHIPEFAPDWSFIQFEHRNTEVDK